MPQLQNLVLTDRASTPVNHTFTPRDIVSNVGSVVESSGVPIGDNRVTVSLSKTSTGKFKGSLRFTFPVVATQTVNGVDSPVLTRTAYCNVDFTFDQSSTEQERKDCVGMVMSALDSSQALVNDTLILLQGVY